MVQVAVSDIARLSGVHPDAARADGFARLARAAAPGGALSARVGGVSVHLDRLSALAGARLTGEAAALREAAANAASGVALLQTADRGLAEIDSRVTELIELATRASDPDAALSATDRARLDAAFAAARAEIDSIAADTAFGSLTPLAGSLSLGVQVGIGGDPADSITLALSPAKVTDLAPALAGASLDSQANAASALNAAEAARDAVGLRRGAVAGDLQRLASAAQVANERAAAVDAAGRGRAAPEISIDFARLLAERVAEEAGLDLTPGTADLLRNLLVSLDGRERDGAAAPPDAASAPASGTSSPVDDPA